MAIDWDASVLAPLVAVFGEDQDKRPTYTPQLSGVPFAIDGVFDNPYKGLAIDPDGLPVIATREPCIGVRLAQFAVPPVKGDRILIPSVSQAYLVSDVHPDGKGWAKLMLTKTT